MRIPRIAALLVPALAVLPAGAAFAQQAAPAAKSPADKTPESDRLRIEFSDTHRVVTAFYPNRSQARLKVYSVTRYDAETSKPREVFVVELKGAGIVDQIRLDADDAASIDKVVGILERFKSQADKSGKLKVSMLKRKADTDAALSREETRLVELKSAAAPDAAEIAKSEQAIESLKTGVALADEIAAMPVISGVIGTAKLNNDRPEYPFVASFEPEREVFTLSAGYSFRIASDDAKYFIDLLKRTQEFKTRLLENETKKRKVRAEIDAIFAGKDS